MRSLSQSLQLKKQKDYYRQNDKQQVAKENRKRLQITNIIPNKTEEAASQHGLSQLLLFIFLCCFFYFFRIFFA